MSWEDPERTVDPVLSVKTKATGAEARMACSSISSKVFELDSSGHSNVHYHNDILDPTPRTSRTWQRLTVM